MISVASTVYYSERDSKFVSAQWLTDNTIFVWQGNGVTLVRSLGRKPRTILYKSGLPILAVCKNTTGQSIFVLTEQQLDIYRPTSGQPTIESYQVTSLLTGVAVCLAPNDHQFILVDESSQVYIHTPQNGWQLLGSLRITKPKCGCKISNEKYAFGSAYGEIEIVSFEPFHSHLLRRVHGDSIQDIAKVGPNTILTVSRDRNLYCWQINQELDENWSIRDFHDHFINCLAIVDGQVWTGGSDGVVKVLSLADKQIVATLRPHEDAIREIAISPNNQKIITTSDDGTYKVLSVKQGTLLGSYGKTRTYISSADIQFEQSGFKAIVGKTNGDVLLIQHKDRKDSTRQLAKTDVRVRAVNFTSTGNWICGLENGLLELFDLEGKKLRSERIVTDTICSIEIEEADSRLWCGRRNGQVDLWQIGPLAYVKSERIHESIVGDILEIGGNQLLTCSDDQTIKLLNASSLRVIKTISIGSSAINNLIILEKSLLASTDDGKVFVLDAINHTMLGTYVGHNHPVRALCGLSNGFVSSGDRNGWLHIWHSSNFNLLWKTKFGSRVITLAYYPTKDILLVVTEKEVVSLLVSVPIGANTSSIYQAPSLTTHQSNRRPMLLICALYKERDALLEKLHDLPTLIQERSPDGAIRLLDATQHDCISIIEAIGSSGNISSRRALQQLMTVHNPSIVILFGIAAGIRQRVRIGDTIVTNQVWDLRKSKVSDSVFEFEPQQINSPESIQVPLPIQNLQQLLATLSAMNVTLTVDLLCGSSDNLVRSRTYMEAAAKTHRKLGAVEMEAAGVAEVCGSYNIPFFIVKTISDYGDEHKDDSYHQLCCTLAASTVLYGFLVPFLNSRRHTL